MRTLTVSLLCALLLAGAVAAPVGAKPLERENYSWEFSEDGIEICGVVLNLDAHGSGRFLLKEGKRGDPTPYLFDNYRWEAVWTDPNDPSRGFIESGNGLWRDHKIVNLYGTVYEFTVKEVGAPYQITTLDGRRVYRDRGRITWRFVVDTLGDDDLSNDIFLEDPMPVSVAGPHPILAMDEDAWCDAVLGILN